MSQSMTLLRNTMLFEELREKIRKLKRKGWKLVHIGEIKVYLIKPIDK